MPYIPIAIIRFRKCPFHINATAEDCANYCVTLFSDLTKMITMQNLFHDGGYSTTGVSDLIMKKAGITEG